jgi:hypothetical protein
MTTVFTLRVFANGVETRNAETQHIERAMKLAMQSIRSTCGSVLEGKIIDDGGVIAGEWRYSPVAAA